MTDRTEMLMDRRGEMPADLPDSALDSASRHEEPLYPEVGVIALVMEPYSAQWTSRQHVLTRLARYFRVLWVNPAPEWRVALHEPRLRALRARTHRIPGQPDTFAVYDAPPWLSKVYRPKQLSDLLARRRLAVARRELSRQGCTRIVLYIWHVSFADALGRVAHDVSCYHIYDEYSNAELEQPLDPIEERLIRSVGQVITVSPTMFERKGRLNPNSARLTNGVEFDAFADPVPEPADLAPIPRPRVGYAGFIKRQLDWELLEALVTRRPEWSFVFVGAMRPHSEIAPALDRMAALPNVYFLGSKSTPELAHYPQHFDVCMMPYRVNDYSKYIYPLKLQEYLASGSPVVSVPLPVLQEVGGLVATATDADTWEDAIKQQLSSAANAASLRAARQAEARRHDWNVIVDTIAQLIVRRLALEPRTR